MGLTILVVDDSVVMRALIKRVMDVVDAPVERVIEATNGREALAALEANSVDVLLTDLSMPVMTGLELLREVKSSGRWPQLVCAVISTDKSEPRRREVAALGVELFLEKPFRPEVMRDVLSQVRDRVGAS